MFRTHLGRHAALALAAIGWAQPSSVRAQVPDTTLGDTLLAHATLIPPFRDTLRLQLHRTGQYRIAVRPGATGVRVVPLQGRGEAFAPRVREGRGELSTIVEVSPRTDGVHAVLLTPPHAADTVWVWVWADTAREQAFRERRERQWGIGGAVAVGYHTGYRTRTSEPSPQSSGDFEAGLLLGSSGRLAFLAGVNYDGRYSGAGGVTSVFAEPRIRLFRWPLAARALSFEATGRIARGNSSRITVDPSLVGIGGLLAYQLDRQPGSRGWRLGLQLTQNWVSNVPDHSDLHFTRGALTLSWLP